MPIQNDSLSLIVLSRKEPNNWSQLLSRVHLALESLNVPHEILIAAPVLDEDTRKNIEQHRCAIVSHPSEKYGMILRAAIDRASGDYIVTIDAEELHSADIIGELWQERGAAEIVIGSRYTPGGAAEMPVFRKLASKVLNLVFSRGLDLQVQDMSSGFRLYNSFVLKGLRIESKDYEILQEILVQARMLGYQIVEIPFHYQSHDPDYLRALQFGWSYLRTFTRLWKLRNSIASADYDARAYNALMPPQRYWQRQRYKIITTLIQQNGNAKCVDVGCGSSRMIGALPQGSIVLDILIRKLRYARQFGRPAIQGSIFQLPIPGEAFPCVLCSQVIEHVPRPNVLEELDRVLEPGGFLILGTPDYGRWQWLVIEWLYKVLLPQAYADEHITHYTYHELVNEFVSKRGYTLETTNYILKGELILGLRKPIARRHVPRDIRL